MILHLTIFILLLGCELFYFKIADRYNIIDRPNERSSHTQLTIRGGGVIFWLAILGYFSCNGLEYPWFFVGLTTITAISFADDILTLSNRVRLPIQLLSMGFLLLQLDIFSTFSPFLLLVIWIVGVGIINGYNFMDGINGITGGYSTVVVIALWIVNNYHVQFVSNDLIINVLLGLTVFNIFNFRKKARCFAGDVGSISIAFIVLFLIMKASLVDHNPIYILFLTVYGVDSIFTIVQRLWLKQNIFKAHRLHLFQVIVHDYKKDHLQVSLYYMIGQAVICGTIISTLSNTVSVQRMVSVSIALVAATSYIVIKTYLMKVKNRRCACVHSLNR